MELKQDNQIKNFRGNRKENFQIGDIVMARDFRRNYPRMSEAQIIEQLFPRSCVINFKEGGIHKRHYDQLQHWREIENNNKTSKPSGEINVENDKARPIVRKSTRVKKPVRRFGVIL